MDEEKKDWTNVKRHWTNVFLAVSILIILVIGLALFLFDKPEMIKKSLGTNNVDADGNVLEDAEMIVSLPGADAIKEEASGKASSQITINILPAKAEEEIK